MKGINVEIESIVFSKDAAEFLASFLELNVEKIRVAISWAENALLYSDGAPDMSKFDNSALEKRCFEVHANFGDGATFSSLIVHRRNPKIELCVSCSNWKNEAELSIVLKHLSDSEKLAMYWSLGINPNDLSIEDTNLGGSRETVTATKTPCGEVALQYYATPK